MGDCRVLRRPGGGAGDPPDRVLRPSAGAGPMKANPAKANPAKADTAMASVRITSVSRQRAVTGLALVVLAAVAIAFPLVFSSPVITNYAVYALIFVAVVSAWNVFSGFSGYISLGHAAFFRRGASSVGIAARDWHVNGVSVFALLP